MKTLVVLISSLAIACANWINIDWSQVRPIEEFDHYWNRLPAELQLLRKHTPSRRIINGQEATPGQFPYQIALLSQFPLGTGICGGSVLTNNYVLTAAHCVHGSSGGIAIMGAHNRTDDEPTQQRIAFDVDGMHVHAGYALETIRNDIATVRLRSAITFNERVLPVVIPAHSDGRTFEGMIATVSGFGLTSDTSSTPSDVLMYTTNQIITNSNCLALWNNDARWIQPQNICQSGDGARSSCNSDSGGPLTVRDGDASLQVGIVSFGTTVCASKVPSVFVRVSYFLGWIEEHSDYLAAP